MDQNQPNKMYITDDEAKRIIALLGEDADANLHNNNARANESRALMNEINNRFVSLVGQPNDSPERTAQLKTEADARAASLSGKHETNEARDARLSRDSRPVTPHVTKSHGSK